MAGLTNSVAVKAASKSRSDRMRRKPAEPTYEELKAQVEELNRQANPELTFDVGVKGGVSVYGLGRFPVTLYYEQWIRLLDAAPSLKNYLETAKGQGRLKLKS
jgi:hypothetical protein